MIRLPTRALVHHRAQLGDQDIQPTVPQADLHLRRDARDPQLLLSTKPRKRQRLHPLRLGDQRLTLRRQLDDKLGVQRLALQLDQIHPICIQIPEHLPWGPLCVGSPYPSGSSRKGKVWDPRRSGLVGRRG